MSGLLFTTAACGAGRFTPDKPTLSYAGSGTTNNGKFTITNYNSSFIYTVTSGNGTVSGNTLTVTVATGNATLVAKSPKGFTNSPGIIAYRQAATQYAYFVETGPFTCYRCDGQGCCAPGCCGCGTCYSETSDDPNDNIPPVVTYYCLACCACGYTAYAWTNYGPQGYTWSGSNYNNGSGEWWKIV